MKHLNYSFILLLIFVFGFGVVSAEEEPVIPPGAHEKAVKAVKALGPGRGAVAIDYKVVKILGIVKGIKSKSEKIKAALKDLGARETETEFRIELSGDILFDFDKWDIRPVAEGTLRKVGDVINVSGSTQVMISGHTDAKGSDEYNQTLSEKRAESVKGWLIKNAGADAKIIKTVGYGETKPVAPNTKPDGSDNPDGRQKNRRVEITVKKK
ncbi:MAG: OmpA family protein [bacterium]|nr:OmpA family protein [bacterium]